MKSKRKIKGLTLAEKCFVMILLVLEFYFVIVRFLYENCEQLNIEFILCGYLLLLMILLGNIHSKNVSLRYENEIGMTLKSVLLNLIMMVFLLAMVKRAEHIQLFIRFLILLLLNIGSILLSRVLIQFVAACFNEDEKKILYICGSSMQEIRSDLKKNMSHTIVLAESELQELYSRILENDIVYLWDVSAERRNDLLKFCYENEKLVYSTAKLSDVLLRSSGIAQDLDTPIYFYSHFGPGRFEECIKRVTDVLGALLLLLLLLPVFFLIAVCIKFEDGGPVFYKQERCTKGQKHFRIYKFRSMVTDAEKRTGVCLAQKNDSRLTKVGRFIRNTKLDELPQLFNILKGDMSFVGPRPERPELIEKAVADVPEFVLRMKVKAGLTGYAQVRGNYNTEFLDKLKWDLMYIENYSLLLDIKIIIMTIFVIFQKSNKEDFSKWEI